MTKCRVLRVGVQDGDRGLVQDRYGRLVDDCWWATRRWAGRRARRKIAGRQIVQFRGARLIASEVVTLQENPGEGRVIRINPSVDIGDDSGSGNLKLALRRRDPDDLCRWLIGIAVPNRRIEVSYRRIVREGCRRCRRRIQTAYQTE